ncbi:MAG: hypothetical protein RLZZ453_486 [Chlamydiota bacterium]|jgi:predicted  nucleic acid-binding Zn-ribbon protein
MSASSIKAPPITSSQWSDEPCPLDKELNGPVDRLCAQFPNLTNKGHLIRAESKQATDIEAAIRNKQNLNDPLASTCTTATDKCLELWMIRMAEIEKKIALIESQQQNESFEEQMDSLKQQLQETIEHQHFVFFSVLDPNNLQSLFARVHGLTILIIQMLADNANAVSVAEPKAVSENKPTGIVLNNERSDLEARLRQPIEKIKQLEDTIDALHKKIIQIENVKSQGFSMLEECISRLRDRITTQETQITELTTRLSACESRIAQYPFTNL